MNRILLILAVLMMVFAGLAEAQYGSRVQSRAGRWEASLQTRYTASKDLSGENGSNVSLDSDLGWGFGFGYNFNEQFNLGVLFSWRSIPYSGTIVPQDDSQTPQNYNSFLDTSTFALQGRWTPMKGTFSPYVEGGIGWVNIDTNIVAGVSSGCWWYPYWGYVCGNYPVTYGKDAATYDLGAGVNIMVSQSLFFRVGYEHAWVDLDSYDGADMFRLDFGGLF